MEIDSKRCSHDIIDRRIRIGIRRNKRRYFDMLEFIFTAALVYVVARMIIWAIKAMWGIAKIVAFVVLLPALIAGLALSGLFFLAAILLAVSVLFSTIGGLIPG